MSLLVWAFVYPMPDSVQFHYLPVYLLLNLIIFVLLATAFEAIKKSKKAIKLSFTAILVVIIALNISQLKDKAFFKYDKLENIYSTEYISHLTSKLSNLDGDRIGVLIKPKVNVKISFDANPYWNVNPMDNYFADFNIINISTCNYDLSNCDLLTKSRAEKSLQNAPFTRFVKEWHKTDKSTSIDVLQFHYVNSHNIKFIILDRGAELPTIFDEHVKSKIIDMKSGETTVFLN